MKKFLSKRGQVSDFIVMDLFEEARNLAKKGKNIIHFEAGQPTNKLPRTAFTEAINKIKTTNVSYTSPLGLDLLKKKISSYYLKKYHLKINYKKIIITFGSSGAFILSFLSSFDKGATIGVTVPNYPAYKNMIKALTMHSWLNTDKDKLRLKAAKICLKTKNPKYE